MTRMMSRFFSLLMFGFSFIVVSQQARTSSLNKEEQRALSPLVLSLPKEKSMWGIGDEQLDELFSASSNLICLADDRFFHRISQTYLQMFGGNEQDILRQQHCEKVHPDDQQASQNIANQSTDNSLVHHSLDAKKNLQMVINFENRRLTEAGDYRNIQWMLLLQVAGVKTQAPILCIGQDVTLKKQAEAQHQTLVQAQLATKIKSTFVAHMSHELRTPLNGVLGFIELALEEELSDKVRSYLMHAYDSANLLLEIANDIIDVSRIEANALKIDNVAFDPKAELSALMPLLKLQTDRKKLQLKLDISPTVPAFLKGDPGRFKQIFLNLSSNAIKFTTQGKVSLKLDGHVVPGQPTFYHIQGRVKDTGMGMDPQFVQKLFQPFSQEDHSMTRQFGGAGLGLYITKELCEKMGGSVHVISTPGFGSTFQFQFNLEMSDAHPPASVSPSPLSVSPVLTSPLSVSKVLVVDDNAMNQEFLKILLTRWGCIVDIASNGFQAVTAIQSTLYDLILMDGEMPEMDGLEATRLIRKRFTTTELPIIGLTAHAMTDHRTQFLQAGMNGYLTKPVQRDALIFEIQRCCAKK